MPLKNKEEKYKNKTYELEKEIERLRKNIKKQKYGLIWLDVPEAFENDVENKLPILREVPKLAIKNKNDKPTHILIEGDNYHALSCLNYTHKGKVDVIYIDPPYNTGSDGFKYKDKRILNKFPDGTLVPKDSPFRHSYWLSFMSKRLELAKNLLKKNGVIFISINEDELAQLKLLCDGIFFPSNYLTTFSIKVRHEERILKGDKDFHEVVEYLLLYRKSNRYKTIKKIYANTSLREYHYEVIEKIRTPRVVLFGRKKVEVFMPGEFEIKKIKPGKNNLKKINIGGTIKEGNSSGRFFMKFIEPLKEGGVLYKAPNIGNDKFSFRYFLSPIKGKRVNGDYFQGVPIDRKKTKKVPYPNFFDFVKEFNAVGYEGGVTFGGGKKPIKFIQHFLQIGTSNKNAVILDFFAGSGSTGEAVMDLNQKDHNNRQFILVTNNDEVVNGKKHKIMTDVCYPRIKGALKKFRNSIRFYKTDFVGKNNILNAIDKYKTVSGRCGCRGKKPVQNKEFKQK